MCLFKIVNFGIIIIIGELDTVLKLLNRQRIINKFFKTSDLYLLYPSLYISY
jgi:hypothetical protein